jgi:hypothetical protein
VLHNQLNKCNYVLGLALTEVNVKLSEIHPFHLPGFTSYHKLRHNQKGGGILFYLKENIAVQVIDIEIKECESLILTANLGSKTVLIINIYRPPHRNKKDFLTSLESFIEGRNEKQIILLGDFNLNLKCKRDLTVAAYKNILASSGFMTCINKTTRLEIRNCKVIRSCLDHISLKGFHNNNINSFIIKTKPSDHFPVGIFIHTNEDISDINSKRSSSYLCNRTVRQMMNNINWLQLLTFSDPDCIYQQLHKQLSHIYTKATVKTTNENKVKTYKQPWINDAIYLEIQRKDNLYRKWKSNSSNDIHRQNYKIQRNKVTALLRKSKNYFYNQKFKTPKNDIRKTWQLINNLRGVPNKTNVDVIIKRNFI